MPDNNKKGDAEDGGDWHLKRSYKVLKTIVHKGDSVHWKTFSISTDLIIPSADSSRSGLQSVVLFQGVPNMAHTLKIVSGKGLAPSVEMLKIYYPYYNR